MIVMKDYNKLFFDMEDLVFGLRRKGKVDYRQISWLSWLRIEKEKKPVSESLK